jgi:hypothetical protein
MKDLCIEKCFGMRSDVIGECLDQVLRFPAACSNEDGIPPMDMAEDFFLGSYLLGIGVL